MAGEQNTSGLSASEAKNVAAQVRREATMLERYLAEQVGQRGDYSHVRNLRALADRISAELEDDDGGALTGERWQAEGVTHERELTDERSLGDAVG